MFKTTTCVNAQDFWRRLNQTFVSRGIANQKKWCEENNLQYSTLKNAQYSNAVPTLDSLTKYAQALNTSLDYLLFGKDNLNNAAVITSKAKDIAIAFDKADEATQKVVLRILDLK